MTVYNNKPLLFNNSKDLFDNIVEPKFIKLGKESNIIELYDIIFAIGALQLWLEQEQANGVNVYSLTSEEILYYNALRSVYNHTKHLILTRKNNDLYVSKYGETLFDEYKDGNAIWNDNFQWNDNKVWVENIIGESKGIYYYCEITDDSTSTSTVKNYFIYEIIKKIYEMYKNKIR